LEVVIDNFEDVSKWQSSNIGIIIDDNKFSSHILSGNSSFRVTVKNGMRGEYFQRVFNDFIDVSNFGNLRVFISRYNGNIGNDLDFKMKFGVGIFDGSNYNILNEWYVPIIGKAILEPVNVDISSIDSFNFIRFTYLSDVGDVWWFDHLIACNDEFVIDSLLAIKGLLDCSLKFSLGNVNKPLFKGNNSLELVDWSFVTRYSLLQIEEDGIIERHVVDGEVSNGVVNFMDELYFDGKYLKNDFSSTAKVSLVVPAFIASNAAPFIVPGIYISGFVPIVDTLAHVEYFKDSFIVSEKKYRIIKPRRDLKLPVEIEVVSSNPELMISINNFIQKLFSDVGFVLVNGVKYDLYYEDTPRYDAGNLEGDVPYTLHFYSVRILDVLNAEVSWVTIPSYHFELNFN